MEKSLKDLNLTNDELDRLGKAFKDPKFLKLFAEYAEELNDPENKRRYEEEIRMAEMERGMDLEFINPTGYCVLKSRNWPSLASERLKKLPGKDVPKLSEGQKVFLNICSSEKLGKPEMKRSGDGRGATWSIPHSFAPPTEDLDKENKMCLVVDVVFHPEAVERSKASQAFRGLIFATAVEGVHRQFGFHLGMTREQAKATWKSDKTNEKAILSSVRLLKGVTHKGALRATVIRRKRPDFAECQERLHEAEKAAFSEARRGPNPKEALAALSKYKRCMDDCFGKSKLNTSEAEDLTSKYKRPEVKVTHSSEFDMLNYTNGPTNEGLPVRPSAIKVEVSLPGIESAACLDLDITQKRIHLQCEKPVAYQLDLDLSYPVDPDKGKAKFNKANSKLLLTLPVIPAEKPSPPMFHVDETQDDQPTNDPQPLIEVLSSAAAPEDGSSNCKKRRRKRNKRRAEAGVRVKPGVTASSDSESGSGLIEKTSKTDTNHGDVSTAQAQCSVKTEKLSPSKLVVPKTYSLALVRVRQDPASFVVVLSIRNVLPTSLELMWSGFNHKADDPPYCPLRLMLTCASRGGGGCTLNWGVVLHCPAPRPDTPPGDAGGGGGGGIDDDDGELGEPRLLRCDVSTNNVALVFEKPAACGWWDSVAIGRALGPGLQEVPVMAAAPDLTDLSVCPANGTGQSSRLCLTVHSSDCVELSSKPSFQGQNQIEAPPEAAVQPSAPPPTTCRKPWADSDIVVPLKGILKQRSISESSLDGNIQGPIGGGIGASTHLLCSDEFPSNSENELAPADFPPVQRSDYFSCDDCGHERKIGRRRLHSVNFSKKDENVSFSPHDPVQTLHVLLRNKAKNARRSERRRRHNSFTASSITLTEMQTSSGGISPMPPAGPINNKQRRKHLRKCRSDECTRDQALDRQGTEKTPVEKELDQISAENASSEAASNCCDKAPHMSSSCLGNEEKSEKSDATQLSAVLSTTSSTPAGNEAGPPRMCNGRGLMSKDQLMRNPHATTCPVPLTADVILELDEE